MWRILISQIVVLSAVSAQAEENVALRAGVGRGVVEGYCNTCHSLDYVRINAPFLAAVVAPRISAPASSAQSPKAGFCCTNPERM